MYFLHAINSDRQTRLLNVLGQIAVILGDKKKLSHKRHDFPGWGGEVIEHKMCVLTFPTTF